MSEEYFIFAGRLDKQKGIDVLLEAWKLMGKDAPKLLICGTGPMEGWCKEYIQENGLDSVEMKGFVPNIEARKLIANSKALILPTQWYEGFPMSIVEAYSVGTPVIGSDMGNVGSLIEEGVTGWKFDSDNANSLLDAVRMIKRTALDNRKIREFYSKQYSASENYKMLTKIYEEVHL